MSDHDTESIAVLKDALEPLIEAAMQRSRALLIVASGLSLGAFRNETMAEAKRWKHLADIGSFALARAIPSPDARAAGPAAGGPERPRPVYCNPQHCTFGNFDFAWTLAENDRLQSENDKLKIEIAAIAIYDDFPYDGPPGTTKPAWLPFGNSLKQDEARRMARASAGGPERPLPLPVLNDTAEVQP